MNLNRVSTIKSVLPPVPRNPSFMKQQSCFMINGRVYNTPDPQINEQKMTLRSQQSIHFKPDDEYPHQEGQTISMNKLGTCEDIQTPELIQRDCST